MSAPDYLFSALSVINEITQQRAELRRDRISRGVGDIEGYGPCPDYLAENLHEKIPITARGVFRRKFDIVDMFLGVTHRPNRSVQNFVAGHPEFVLHMNIRSGDKDMNPRMLGLLYRLQSPFNVSFLSPGKAHHRRPLDLFGDTLYGGKIPLGGDGKPPFNHIDAELLQLARDDHFFLHIHARTRRLFSVPKRRIKDLYDIILYDFH